MPMTPFMGEMCIRDRVRRCRKPRHGCRAGFDGAHRRPGGLQRACHDGATERLRVDDENASVGQLRKWRWLLESVDAAADREMESAATTDLAFDPDAPAEKLGQARRYAQSETGAAVLAGDRPVGLREGVENRRQFFFGNTDATVGHLSLIHI